MATTIKLKNSVTTTNAPSSLVQGEVAINITDKKVWVGNAATTPVQLLGDGGSASFTSIAFGAGTVSNPSITFTGDTNTGIYSPAADTIAFTEGGVESMRIDSSGNVGIGTSTALSKLTSLGASSTVTNSVSTRNPVASFRGGNDNNRFDVLVDNSGATSIMGLSAWNAAGATTAMTFYTGTTGAEAMRIDSSGNVAIGRTSSISYKLDVDAGAGSAARLLSNNAQVLIGFNSTSFNYYDADTQIFRNNAGTERMRITNAGNVGIGTSSPAFPLDIASATGVTRVTSTTGTNAVYSYLTNTGGDFYFGRDNSAGSAFSSGTAYSSVLYSAGAYPMVFYTNAAERMRITSGGSFVVGKTATNSAVGGFGVAFPSAANCYIEATNTRTDGLDSVAYINRQGSDGNLITFLQADTTEGTISVSGTTVSYNGGHLSRYAQTTTPKDDSIVKGTVLSNLDEMNEYVDTEGNPVDNEQLNKVKVSDVEGDVNVAGVFVNWSHDEAHNVDEINMAMTGDMIIRIAQGVVVQKGDLLMSAGDGTAKPQGDDIVRSKTIAKVTSNHVTCTYADGSYCVPCVMMAC